MDAPFPDKMMPCIEEFFREVHPRLTPGQDVYPEVFHTELFFPLQRMRETEKMIRIARRYEPKTVMEIGADKGGGLYHWCMCLPSVESAIACEIRGCPYRYEFSNAFTNVMFTWMERSSRPPLSKEDVSKKPCDACDDGLITEGHPPLDPHVCTFCWGERYVHDESRSIDVLFIDGEKPFMLEDFVAYRPLMAERSVVFLHDINDSYGRPALWNIAKLGYTCHEIIDVSEVPEALAREGAGVPPADSYEGWLRHWKGHSAGVGVIYIGEPRL